MATRVTQGMLNNQLLRNINTTYDVLMTIKISYLPEVKLINHPMIR